MVIFCLYILLTVKDNPSKYREITQDKKRRNKNLCEKEEKQKWSAEYQGNTALKP